MRFRLDIVFSGNGTGLTFETSVLADDGVTAVARGTSRDSAADAIGKTLVDALSADDVDHARAAIVLSVLRKHLGPSVTGSS